MNFCYEKMSFLQKQESRVFSLLQIKDLAVPSGDSTASLLRRQESPASTSFLRRQESLASTSFLRRQESRNEKCILNKICWDR